MTRPSLDRRRWSRLKRLVVTLAALALVLTTLFVSNGLWLSWKTPDRGVTSHPALSGAPARVKVMAYNIAKCFAHRGGVSFAGTTEIEGCLGKMAALIRAEAPHVVFLSEINIECGPAPVDQVRFLADRAGMHSWVFGENYSWGLPFFRIRSGNAILSRFPLKAHEVLQLAHGAPFYSPMGNRRALFATLSMGDARLLLGALRNDSFDYERNADQVRQLLTFIGARDALLGGDLNAPPASHPMRLWRESGRFSAHWEGPPTFPADAPTRCIDYVLAPRSWRLVDHRVIADTTSDHRPVISVFERPLAR